MFSWLAALYEWFKAGVINSWRFFFWISGGGFVVWFWNKFLAKASEVKTVIVTFLNNLLSSIGVSDQFPLADAFTRFNDFMNQWSALLPVKLIYTTLLFLFGYYLAKTIINVVLWIVRRFIDIIP